MTIQTVKDNPNNSQVNSKCVGVMETDFITFFQAEIEKKMRKSGKLYAIELLYLIDAWSQKDITHPEILERIKNILAQKVRENEHEREVFSEDLTKIGEAYTNEWVKEYFGLEKEKPEYRTQALPGDKLSLMHTHQSATGHCKRKEDRQPNPK